MIKLRNIHFTDITIFILQIEYFHLKIQLSIQLVTDS